MFILCAFISGTSFSQTKQINQQPLTIVKYNANVDAPLTSKELGQIKEAYGDQAEQQVLSRQQRVKDIKNILRNRVVFKEVKSGETLKECPLLSSVPLFDYYVSSLTRDMVFDPATFNPLKYDFSFNSRGGGLYKVDNTNYYIIIKSQHQ